MKSRKGRRMKKKITLWVTESPLLYSIACYSSAVFYSTATLAEICHESLFPQMYSSLSDYTDQAWQSCFLHENNILRHRHACAPRPFAVSISRWPASPVGRISARCPARGPRFGEPPQNADNQTSPLRDSFNLLHPQK